MNFSKVLVTSQGISLAGPLGESIAGILWGSSLGGPSEGVLWGGPLGESSRGVLWVRAKSHSNFLEIYGNQAWQIASNARFTAASL